MIPRKKSRKKIPFVFFSAAVIVLTFVMHGYAADDENRFVSNAGTKSVRLVDDGLISFFETKEETVRTFLDKAHINLQEGDSVFPVPDTKIFSGTQVIVRRARAVMVKVDGNEKHFRTQAASVEEALAENHVALGEDDIVKPGRETFVVDKLAVTVTRVEIKEEFADKKIPFEKKSNEDPKLSFRITKVTQKGEEGTKRTTYRVAYHDGKEVKRTALKTETIKEPVTEVTTQGTLVKTGKSHRGAASWYAWTGTMAAANPWLPMGSYVKVTNVDNGKSVIVKINDRGPFAPGRIIDLDKVAFAKIASLGAGVVNVKMEEIVN